MCRVVVEVVAAQAHRGCRRDVTPGDHDAGQRCERREQLLDGGVVE
jgi:hypothetical protein